MQTILKPSWLTSTTLYADKGNLQAFTAWLITTLIFLVGFRLAREAASAVLMKLHEVLIQKNAAGL
jgi:hypothetical protein